jgi:hypothetical protein
MEMSPHWEPSSVEVKISFLISERRIHCKLRTLVTWLKLGEFLLFSVGASSESGRGIELPVLIGDVEGVPFWMRRGWTCSVSAILKRVRCSKFVDQQLGNPTPLRVLTGCEGDAIVAIRWSVPVGSLAIRDTDVLFLE